MYPEIGIDGELIEGDTGWSNHVGIEVGLSGIDYLATLGLSDEMKRCRIEGSACNLKITWHLSAIVATFHDEGGQLCCLVGSLTPSHRVKQIAWLEIKCERIILVHILVIGIVYPVHLVFMSTAKRQAASIKTITRRVNISHLNRILCIGDINELYGIAVIVAIIAVEGIDDFSLLLYRTAVGGED